MEEKEKQSKGTTILVVALVLITIASLILATFAWARYATEINAPEVTAVAAKWNITGNSSNLTWSRTFEHVVSERLAPGTNGTIPVSFSVNDTEVDVHYKITIVSVENKPTNLKFYTDSTKTTEINPTSGTAYEGIIKTTDAAASKTINEGIYWDWPYRTGTTDDDPTITDADRADTSFGEGTDEQRTMKITLKIDAWQVQPVPGSANP